MKYVKNVSTERIRRSFADHKERAKKPRDLIHTDVCGPMSVESLGKRRYYVLFKDDFSKHRTIYFIRDKYEVYDKINLF